ncbi:fimbria/pilus outer membrane usher protein [Pararobbsia alpina]|uniref:fimbria/pilus outer membrane usher protein n=1 Tax=Pararobbsia alpina TaxID=621374 RepID=UPI0039A6F301
MVGLTAFGTGQAYASESGFALDALPSTHRLRTVPRNTLVQLTDISREPMRVDLYVNDRYIGNERVTFDDAHASKSPDGPDERGRSKHALTPCLDPHVLIRAGVEADHLSQVERVLAHAPALSPSSAPVRAPALALASASASALVPPSQPASESGSAVAPLPVPRACVPLLALSADATSTLNANDLRLDVSIPQIWMRSAIDGANDKARWDAGIPSFFSTYAIDVAASRADGSVRKSAALTLVTGINTGLWHWRQYGRIVFDPAHPMYPRRYRVTRTYADRPVPGWNAVMKFGEVETSSLVQPHVSMVGVTLQTDERMLPDVARGYAPAVRGVASSRSTVRVTQQGHVVFDTVVPAGAFNITELRPVGNRGDLDVALITNGSETRHVRIPAAAMPRMIRENAVRFALSTGYATGLRTHPLIADGSMRYGVTDRMTVQAGGQRRPGLSAASIGVAGNTYAGAWSVDLDGAWSGAAQRRRAGRLRLGIVPTLRSSTWIWSASASWRAGRGALDLTDRVEPLADDHDTPSNNTIPTHASTDYPAHSSTRYSPHYSPSYSPHFAPHYATRPMTHSGTDYAARPSHSARAPHEGNLSVTVSHLWRSHVASYATAALQVAGGTPCSRCRAFGTSLELGLSTRTGSTAFVLTLAHTRPPGFSAPVTRLSVDMRASIDDAANAPRLSSRIDTDAMGTVSQRWGLSGSIDPADALRMMSTPFWASGGSAAEAEDDDPPLAYAVTLACRERSVDLNFVQAHTQIQRTFEACAHDPSVELSRGDRLGDTHLSISGAPTVSLRRDGSVVMHRNGITWGPAIGTSGAALLDTRGVPELPVVGSNAKTDAHGFAVIPSLRAYRPNTIEVDATRTPRGVAMPATTRDVVPVPGAIVHVEIAATRPAPCASSQTRRGLSMRKRTRATGVC